MGKHSSLEHQKKIHNLDLQAYASECMGLFILPLIRGAERWQNS
nr:MAG TPA: hypothetical protein [Caudoviricetes sp.]DAZ16628.1 MAG TPA: hypothetical protein [Caudoviricetes sp.]